MIEFVVEGHLISSQWFYATEERKRQNLRGKCQGGWGQDVVSRLATTQGLSSNAAFLQVGTVRSWWNRAKLWFISVKARRLYVLGHLLRSREPRYREQMWVWKEKEEQSEKRSICWRRGVLGERIKGGTLDLGDGGFREEGRRRGKSGDFKKENLREICIKWGLEGEGEMVL